MHEFCWYCSVEQDERDPRGNDHNRPDCPQYIPLPMSHMRLDWDNFCDTCRRIRGTVGIQSGVSEIEAKNGVERIQEETR